MELAAKINQYRPGRRNGNAHAPALLAKMTVHYHHGACTRTNARCKDELCMTITAPTCACETCARVRLVHSVVQAGAPECECTRTSARCNTRAVAWQRGIAGGNWRERSREWAGNINQCRPGRRNGYAHAHALVAKMTVHYHHGALCLRWLASHTCASSRLIWLTHTQASCALLLLIIALISSVQLPGVRHAALRLCV